MRVWHNSEWLLARELSRVSDEVLSVNAALLHRTSYQDGLREVQTHL